MNTATAAHNTNPFPGLRPFREDEEYLFFGRENQVDAMVDKLAATRFLAAVGTSGSGKSSLVNCGLRPALHGGLMTSAGTAWRMAQFRPGSDPMRAMARALAQDGVLFRDYQAGGLTLAEIVDTTLRMSKLGLIDIYEQAQLGDDVNLLVVVDQFEELFRYRQFSAGHQENVYGMSEEAAAFVNLLLAAKAQTAHPIYVVLTMRSDFLGDCTQFTGLAEAINAGQYLVPRMTRDERRAAIGGPVGVGGAEISPVLLTRLVNDVGDNPDQLSILQHALNRTWNQWERSGHNGPLDLPHYESIGTMAHALDQHAERAYAELTTARQQQICEKLFKALTDKATDPRGVRRPTTLGTLCALAEATTAEVTQVIDVFRKPSRSFLMPPAEETLEAETVIDISHESLMRVWERLKIWADEEAQSAHIYRRLAETAVLHGEGKAGLWSDPDLQVALNWREHDKPNSAWARRYHPAFDTAASFLDESVAARRAEEQRFEQQRRKETSYKRTRLLAGILGLAVFVSLGAVFFANTQRVKARVALDDAIVQRAKAEKQTRIAEEKNREAADNLHKFQKASQDALDAQAKLRAFETRRAAEQAQILAMQTKLAQQEASEVKGNVQLSREARDKWDNGDVEGAIGSYDRLLKYYQSHHEPRGEYETRTILASAYLKQGEYRTARENAEKALAIQRKEDRRGEHDNVAVMRDAYNKEGDYASAEKFGERAIKIQEEISGPDRPELIPDLKSQALVKDSLKKPDDDNDISASEPLRMRIAKIHNNSLREVADYLKEFAAYYRNQGDDENEELYLRQELRLEQNIYGDKDPALVETLLNLAAVYRVQGDEERSDSLMALAREIRGGGGPNDLAKGASGLEVQKLQTNLSKLGFSEVGQADGRFGPATELAVINFQRSRGLTPDGVAGEQTLKAIAAEASGSSLFKNVTDEIVSKIFPGTPMNNIKTNLPFVLKALEEAGLSDKDMVLMALATIRAESGGSFAPLTEFPSKFNTTPGGNPFDLYDNRKDLGNQGPPDGEKFRGRGYLQTTGRLAYQTSSLAIGLGDQLIKNPALANQPDVAANILVSSLKSKEQQIRAALADRNFIKARRLVNGGSHGLAEFTEVFKTGQSLLP